MDHKVLPTLLFKSNIDYMMRDYFDWTAFEIYLRAERGLSEVSAQKAIDLLATFAKTDYDKPLTQVNLSAIQKGLYNASERYSPNSINLVKNTLRHWVRFVRDVDNLSDVTRETTFLDRIKRILGRNSEYDSIFAQRIERMLKSTTSTPRQMGGREERLGIPDIVELIQGSRSPKWKALLAFSWDTAFPIRSSLSYTRCLSPDNPPLASHRIACGTPAAYFVDVIRRAMVDYRLR